MTTTTPPKQLTRDEIEALLPWKRPSNIREDNGANCDVTIDGHTFEVRDSGDTGIDTGRTRWKVTCTTCNELVHRGSTSATAQIQMHMSDVYYARKMN